MMRSAAKVGLGVLTLGMALQAHATLVPGVTQTFPDVSMINGTYLIYDHNGGGATVGQLSVVTNIATLQEGAAAGGTSSIETYGTNVYSTALTLNINNATGAFVGGSVSILAGTGAAKFAWSGTITNGGLTTLGTGSLANGTWTVTGDTYSGLPAGLSQFVNNYLTGALGGFIITTGTGFTLPPSGLATTDWLVGAAATTINTTYLPSALISGVTLTAANKFNATVTVDTFATPVPLPAAIWGLLGGLGMLAPVARRRRETHA
jgi:hypothetical protein